MGIEGEYQRSARQERVRQIVQEFRQELTTHEYKLPPTTEAVVVLSAAPEIIDGEEVQESRENVVRIEMAIEVIKQFTAKKLEKSIEEVTIEDCLEFGPPLVLNCGHTQIKAMQDVAERLGYPKEKTVWENCGLPTGVNTKTNFQAMADNPRWQTAEHLTYVTNAYHVPRVARTAAATLPKTINAEIIGVPMTRHPIDVFRKVRGEVKRIITYSDKGDIQP